MDFLRTECQLQPLIENIINNCEVFECTNSDLNEFFSKDFIFNTNELLGKSYCYTLKNSNTIIAAFTVSNDGINLVLLPKYLGISSNYQNILKRLKKLDKTTI